MDLPKIQGELCPGHKVSNEDVYVIRKEWDAWQLRRNCKSYIKYRRAMCAKYNVLERQWERIGSRKT